MSLDVTQDTLHAYRGLPLEIIRSVIWLDYGYQIWYPNGHRYESAYATGFRTQADALAAGQRAIDEVLEKGV